MLKLIRIAVIVLSCTAAISAQAGGYTPEPLGDFIDIVDQVQAQQLGVLGTYLGGEPAP